ncbi:mandelate racemase/muconate lactonizing enzyme family protein [Roseomonas haemaphysalidis]|uniref:Mandelate racemase/muconate lactonizing enzyme family protein n=1 Tax=Roseomonas haemaphysalidis TaxID=2768162 RepID=A0ABS3KK47_9PROT|nr:mandelate racemase/muconate lactonizing enzyme family protein [Roseomonas haemaphysalidis]MBO1077843.1 mandelate racemase/muconate lactonizing enzyme family protein [Roseomonas haemaphysalidis]
MSVTAIRLFHLSAQLPETIGNALVFFDRRDTLMVEVVDSSGLSGWGETWATPAAAAAVIETQLAPLVLGQDPAHTGRLWHSMRDAAGADTQGTAITAVAALDMALHDLAARLRGVPLSTLLGGALRDRVPAYASGPFFKPHGHPYRDFERDAEGYLRAGFRAIKLRSGFRPADDAATAIAIRRLMGPDGTLMLDFNQSYTPRAALAAAARMAEAELLWIEEPAVPEDLAGYRMLSSRLLPALAGGETYGSASQFLPFLEAGCMDVLQPDIAICGGLTGTGRVAALAELFERPVVPHVWGGTVNFHAALHLTATLPAQRGGAVAFPLLEFDAGPNPLLDLAGRPALGADGTVAVPDGPGLGIEIRPDMLAPWTRWHRSLGA